MTITSLALTEDDHQIRHYLSENLRLYYPVTEIRVFETGEAALDSLSKKPVQIALFDVNLPGRNGIDCIQELKTIHPAMQMMIITVYDDSETIFNALRAGAVSYLLKSTPAEKVKDAIDEVAAGGSAISSQIARKVIQHFSVQEKTNEHLEKLSRREREILDQLAKGLRYKEISSAMFISLETVRTHVRNIYEKLQVSGRVEALKKTGLM